MLYSPSTLAKQNLRSVAPLLYLVNNINILSQINHISSSKTLTKASNIQDRIPILSICYYLLETSLIFSLNIFYKRQLAQFFMSHGSYARWSFPIGSTKLFKIQSNWLLRMRRCPGERARLQMADSIPVGGKFLLPSSH